MGGDGETREHPETAQLRVLKNSVSALSLEPVSLFAAANGVLGAAAPPWLVVSP